MKKKQNTAWLKFKKNKMAFFGVIFIFFLALIALFGPFVRPDNSINVNNQQLTISKQKPGFAVDVIRVKKEVETVGFWNKIRNYGWEQPYREIPVSKVKIQGDKLIASLYSPYNNNPIKLEKKSFQRNDLVLNSDKGKKAASYLYHKTYVLGTDRYGRDLLSRLMGGTIISLSVGVISVLISLFIGIPLGALAGYYGGWVDKLIMWVINVIWSIPTLLLVMAIVFAFGKGFGKVFLAVGLTMWVEVARIVRGQVISLREKEFIEAGKALGYSDLRIIFKHILPNITSPIIVISAANFAAAILIEAGLSFLGLGAQIPTPSWGNMIKEHYAFITTDLAYLAYLPGLMIMSLVLAFMLVGNGLRDALDVK